MQQRDDGLQLDAATRRNLELDRSLSGNEDATLFAMLDRTTTAMGSRELRRWLNRPLRDRATLRQRYAAIARCVESRRYQAIADALRPLATWSGSWHASRCARRGRATWCSCARRWRHCRRCAPCWQRCDSPLLAELRAASASTASSIRCWRAPIAAEPSAFLRDGDVIAAGYDPTLDQLRRISTNTDEFLLELEQRERERSGIPQLKLGYNRVQGFFIEIPRAHAERVPADYLRRQTVKSAERFITPELKRFEDEVLGARDKALAREKELFDALLGELIAALAALQDHRPRARQPRRAGEPGGARRQPAVGASRSWWMSRSTRSTAGRHPVVERFSGTSFVPNDLSFDDGRRMLIVTGPNMGGKSTYMRQAALIAVLAHIGSFVPAASARIGPLDRIFTRIGAADDLAGGRSTFMVEMTETANILHNATAHSLVLMDEIGRGTSTFDGLSLAWAVARHLATKVRAFTLFATHYFELTALAQEIPGIVNLHLDATEHGEDLVFLHAVREGPANRSYGLAVARLAGVPREVICRGTRIPRDARIAAPGARTHVDTAGRTAAVRGADALAAGAATGGTEARRTLAARRLAGAL